MSISNSYDTGNDLSWKQELLNFLEMESDGKESERGAKPVFYERECAYCGESKEIDKLKKMRWLRGWICDSCRGERIKKRSDVVFLADHTLKMLSLMYNISFRRRFRVKLRIQRPGRPQYPWHRCYVKCRYLGIGRRVRLYVKRWLPKAAVEAAMVSALLDQYLRDLEMETQIRNDTDGGGLKGKRDDKSGRAGVIIWCTLHYLYVAYGEACAKRYLEKLSVLEKQRYEACEKQLHLCMVKENITMQQIFEKLDDKKHTSSGER